MKWIEVTIKEAMKAPAHVRATIHYHEDKDVWLIPDESKAGEEEAVKGLVKALNDIRNWNDKLEEEWEDPGYRAIDALKKFKQSKRTTG